MGCVRRRASFLFHEPHPAVTIQPGAGHLHRALAETLVDGVKRGHESGDFFCHSDCNLLIYK